MNNGYAICFNKWALDKNIKNELALLIIISSLTAEKGYCFATNKYFSELFNETEVSISNKIKKLEINNYIDIEYEKKGWEVINRKIRLKNILTDDYKSFYQSIKKDFKYNNTNINNINNNNIYSTFENIFVRPLNGIEYETMKSWLKNKTEEEIIDAIKESAKSNIDNIKYIEKVLFSKRKKNKGSTPSWFNEEITSEECEKDEEFNSFIEEFRNDKI